MSNKMKAHEYIPTTIILLTGLLCVTKLIGMFPFDWIWAFVLIWGANISLFRAYWYSCFYRNGMAYIE